MNSVIDGMHSEDDAKRATPERYGGDMTCMDAWRKLRQDADSILVDVRTRAEWNFVGVPDLSSLGKTPVLVEWLDFPDGRPIPDFAARLRMALEEARNGAQAGGEAVLLFLCRSGTRSHFAALAAAKAGLGRCFNVADGFEGRIDSSGHRCSVEGWKAAGLPWRQS